ncbi:hypothetical protein MTR67_020501, partial [Solanum verrucosum]
TFQIFLISFNCSLPSAAFKFQHFTALNAFPLPTSGGVASTSDRRSSTPATAAGDHHQDSGIRKVPTRPDPFHNLSLHLPGILFNKQSEW